MPTLGHLETYQECLRVLKPGGHILAFSAARTYHHLAVTLEQAGFEIRDQIMWIYSSGFPKSQDVGKQLDKKSIDNKWNGWGTCLKPAHEPIALARKPISEKNIASNCQQWGTGAINIDATRVPIDEQLKEWYNKYPEQKSKTGVHTNYNPELQNKLKEENVQPVDTTEVQGRFPSNVIGEIAEEYQKYFYCPKVSRAERHIGFDPNSKGNIIDSEVFGKTPICLDCGKTRNGSTKHDKCDPANIGFQERRTQRSTEVGNNHPTVKPIELMKYLIKLITPPGGIVLDPFNGSGSTGCAAVALGHEYIGCELDPAYVEISKRRIEQYNKSENNFDALFE
jgi:DNA modification methylase